MKRNVAFVLAGTRVMAEPARPRPGARESATDSSRLVLAAGFSGPADPTNVARDQYRNPQHAASLRSTRTIPSSSFGPAEAGIPNPRAYLTAGGGRLYAAAPTGPVGIDS